MNSMITPSGVFLTIAATVSHAHLYTLSDYNDAAFLNAIHEIKVSL